MALVLILLRTTKFFIYLGCFIAIYVSDAPVEPDQLDHAYEHLLLPTNVFWSIYIWFILIPNLWAVWKKGEFWPSQWSDETLGQIANIWLLLVIAAQVWLLLNTPQAQIVIKGLTPQEYQTVFSFFRNLVLVFMSICAICNKRWPRATSYVLAFIVLFLNTLIFLS